MSKKIVTTQKKFTKGQWLFSTSFVLIFTIIIWALMIFEMDKPFQLPASTLGWINYTIKMIFGVAFTAVIIFLNYYLIRKTSHAIKTQQYDNQDTLFESMNKTKVVVICIAIVGSKILYAVLSETLGRAILEVINDPSSVSSWITVVFFSIIAVGFIAGFTWFMIKWNKAKKMVAAG